MAKGHKYIQRKRRQAHKEQQNAWDNKGFHAKTEVVTQAAPPVKLSRRNRLAPLQNKANIFTAVVAEFGMDYKTPHNPTALLRNVKHRDVRVTDHIWMKYEGVMDDFGQFIEGDVVEFAATVSAYVKGRPGDAKNPQRMDYKIDRPMSLKLKKEC